MNGILNENTVVKEYDFNKPDIHEIDFLLDDIIKDRRNRYFHTFGYRLVYDIKIKIISINEEVSFTTTHKSMDFKTEIFGLSKKIKNALQNGVIFVQINKLTKKKL